MAGLALMVRKATGEATEEANLRGIAAAPLASGEVPLESLAKQPWEGQVAVAREDSRDVGATRGDGELEERGNFAKWIHAGENQFRSRHSRRAMRARWSIVQRLPSEIPRFLQISTLGTSSISRSAKTAATRSGILCRQESRV